MIDVKVADWVGTVQVADFAGLSRYDAAFAWELRDTVVALADDSEVKVIVLRTDGGDFAPDVPGAPLPSDRSATWRRVFAGAKGLYQSLAFCKKVVVTEVTGACRGAGSALVLCSDLTVAAEESSFGSPFLAVPESNFVLAALTMRLNRAKAWAVTGDVLDAARAEEVGLVNQVVPGASLRAETDALAARVTAMPLDGVTMSKMLLQAVLDAHGVGRDFDLATHYAARRRHAENAGGGAL
ncbi:enoyl-CoA hydratase/isomerase family protein [Phytohabitans sp. ZYX-F-186]|uniref:Enoyl-CoA hydratase/isomerase family protein n=1 Tax=Phytohabitans maris TaxID=3071409 RepID=A0ABU0ZKF4_9ACTN|nr:enoyl-CoA hydratase/isomerase family protein [Phytohabitans sp. ZYX-F-186]MDQ7907463.1 enoyl-CoA hydratase/isomerase family protein [Phytohabitans sp. ZYX-F-186]